MAPDSNPSTDDFIGCAASSSSPSSGCEDEVGISLPLTLAWPVVSAGSSHSMGFLVEGGWMGFTFAGGNGSREQNSGVGIWIPWSRSLTSSTLVWFLNLIQSTQETTFSRLFGRVPTPSWT